MTTLSRLRPRCATAGYRWATTTEALDAMTGDKFGDWWSGTVDNALIEANETATEAVRSYRRRRLNGCET